MRVTQESLHQALYNGTEPSELKLSMEEDLGKAGESFRIETLNDYYKALDIIRESNYTDRLPWYIRVPANEEYFEINMDSGVITVPAAFQKNGIAVVGDHLAETLFFEVDRYFDTMDLGACAAVSGNSDEVTGTIQIRWVNGTLSGVDKAYALDVTEDKVIFGWIIASEGIGPASVVGNVEFAVTFTLTDNNGVIVAEKNTLAAKVAVKNTLNGNFTEEVIDWASLVNGRPTYSGIANLLQMPSAIIKLNYYPGKENLGQKNTYSVENALYTMLTDGTNPNVAEMNIIAASDKGDYNSAEVIYKWYYNGIEIDPSAAEADREVAEKFAMNAEVAARQALLVDTTNLAVVSRTQESEEDENEETVNLPIWDGKLLAKVPGRYMVKVGNKVQKTVNGNTVYETRWTDSNETVIPLVDNFTLTEVNVPARVVLDKPDGQGGTLDVVLAVEATKNNGDAGLGTITYQWYKVVNGEGVAVANATEATFEPTEAGVYYAEVINTYNNSKIVKDTEVRVNAQTYPVAPDFNVAVSDTDGRIIVCNIDNYNNVVLNSDYICEVRTTVSFTPNTSDQSAFTLDVPYEINHIPYGAVQNPTNPARFEFDLGAFLDYAEGQMAGRKRSDGFYTVTFRGNSVVFPTDVEKATSSPYADAATVQVRLVNNTFVEDPTKKT